MAKKSSRIIMGLVCVECGKQNYVVDKNKINTPTALKPTRHCNKCNKHVEHKEKKKLG